MTTGETMTDDQKAALRRLVQGDWKPADAELVQQAFPHLFPEAFVTEIARHEKDGRADRLVRDATGRVHLEWRTAHTDGWRRRSNVETDALLALAAALERAEIGDAPGTVAEKPRATPKALSLERRLTEAERDMAVVLDMSETNAESAARLAATQTELLIIIARLLLRSTSAEAAAR
jgi:hypothetical protein